MWKDSFLSWCFALLGLLLAGIAISAMVRDKSQGLLRLWFCLFAGIALLYATFQTFNFSMLGEETDSNRIVWFEVTKSATVLGVTKFISGVVCFAAGAGYYRWAPRVTVVLRQVSQTARKDSPKHLLVRLWRMRAVIALPAELIMVAGISRTGPSAILILFGFVATVIGCVSLTRSTFVVELRDHKAHLRPWLYCVIQTWIVIPAIAAVLLLLNGRHFEDESVQYPVSNSATLGTGSATQAASADDTGGHLVKAYLLVVVILSAVAVYTFVAARLARRVSRELPVTKRLLRKNADRVNRWMREMSYATLTTAVAVLPAAFSWQWTSTVLLGVAVPVFVTIFRLAPAA